LAHLHEPRRRAEAAGAVVPVYVIHWNAPQWCEGTVASLRGTIGVQIQVVVVDNGGSTLEPGAIGDSRILTTGRNLGYTGGANQALDDFLQHFPNSAWCVVTSHDLRVRPDTLNRLVEAGTDHDGYGVLAPRRVADDEMGFNDRLLPEIADRAWLSGTCLLLRRSCVEQVGRFDELFGSYVEDVDYCLRARAAGWRVGEVTNAKASQRGSISDSAPTFIAANWVLLRLKHNGAVYGLLSTVGLGAQVCRSALGVVVPGRPQPRRAASRRQLSARVAALKRVVASYRAWNSELRKRDTPPPMLPWRGELLRRRAK
jgi:N-acetylglucosaminyl-diphospho-decaprenol L-rhamnosyltransferase